MTLAIGKRGFSLMELSLVGLVLGLIVALGWPHLRHHAKRITHNNKNESIQTYFTQLKERAILTGQPQDAFHNDQLQGTFFPDGTTTGFTTSLVQVSETGQISYEKQ